MKSLVVERSGDLWIGEFPIPEIDETSALVRVLACGICGTDRKLLHANFKGYDAYPCLIGHEAVGEVIKVGSKVKYLKPGDHVIAPYLDKPVGGCTPSLGGFSEYAVVHDWQVLEEMGKGRGTPGFEEFFWIQKKLPKEIDAVSGVMMVTLREVLAATKHFGFRKNESIVIFGAGAVGLTFVKMAKLIGMSPIISVDIMPQKAGDAKRMGADCFIDGGKQDVAEEVHKICPNGTDYVLDAVGANSLINAAMHLIRSCGRILVYGVSPVLNMQLDWKDAPYNWTLEFFQYPEKDEEAAAHEQVVDWVLEGVLDPKEFVSHVFQADDILKAFDLFQSGQPAKKIVVSYE